MRIMFEKICICTHQVNVALEWVGVSRMPRLRCMVVYFKPVNLLFYATPNISVLPD